jgi:hypothetical protein
MIRSMRNRWNPEGKIELLLDGLRRYQKDGWLRIIIQRPGDVVVTPPGTHHCVWTCWRQDVPVLDRWCVLGGCVFGNLSDVHLAAKLIAKGTGGGARGLWSPSHDILWDLYSGLVPHTAAQLPDAHKLRLLTGSRPGDEPAPNRRGRIRKRSSAQRDALSKARNARINPPP